MGKNKKDNMYFIHIPKNGGTSVCEQFGFDHGHHKYKDVYNEYTNCNFFTIVRNPYDRFISSINYIKMDKSFWHNKNDKTKHPLYDILKPKKLSEICNMLSNNEFKNYIHFDKQNEYLIDGNGIIQKKINIYKLEEIDILNKFFLRKYGKKLIKLNKSNIIYTSKDLNDENKELIYNYYISDFDKLNYEK